MAEIFAQAGFRLGILSEPELSLRLRVITGPKLGEAGADAIEYAIGFGVFLQL